MVFTQAASVAKRGFPSHTVTKQALPSSLANTGVLIQRAKSREVLLCKDEAEDLSKAIILWSNLTKGTQVQQHK